VTAYFRKHGFDTIVSLRTGTSYVLSALVHWLGRCRVAAELIWETVLS